MSKQAQVGLFTLLGFLAVFGIFFVLADFGTRSRGYKIGVHFRSAGGLGTGAQVFLSGVPVGVVDDISLLPDFTTEVVLAIKPRFEIPQNCRFLIQAPITGEPTVLIEPPRDISTSVATLPHEVRPIEQQPRGTNPTSVADLLEQGQGEMRRVDTMLQELRSAEPQLLAQAKSTLNSANELTTNANRSLLLVTAQVQQLADSLQKNLTVASNNVVHLTGSLDTVVSRDSGQVDQLLSQLNVTSKSFGETVDALKAVATNPNLRANLLDTTRNFAVTAKTFAQLTGDLRNVTGNAQTQAQIRDAVARVDATAQKVDSLAGSLGGTSSVYGVDPGATAAPAPAPASGAGAAPAGGAPGGTRTANGSNTSRASTAKAAAALGTFRERLQAFSKDVVQLQYRVSELSPLHPGSARGNVSPLLTTDRGPQSDFNVQVLPHGHTGLQIGVNDIGSNGTSTANAMILNRAGGFTYGGGIEYSRAGLMAGVVKNKFGVEARAYDLRHPTLDTYVNLFATPKLQIFAGERDAIHPSRRTVLGLQYDL